MKLALARSYVGAVGPIDLAFLAARIRLLPLEAFDRVTPTAGRIIDVGCGHGVVAQYLARSSANRRVCGYDPDKRRIAAAQVAARGVSNVEFFAQEFDTAGPCADAVFINGVFVDVDDSTVAMILAAARRSLAVGRPLIVSDIAYDETDWRYYLSYYRERLMVSTGFTKAEGVFRRPPEVWRAILAHAGFHVIVPFDAPVPLHAVFNWVCT